MKAMKGKLLKKFKTIKAIGYLKPERILRVNAADGFVPNSPPKSSIAAQNHLLSPIQEEPKKNDKRCVRDQEPEIIDVSELMKDLEDQETEFVDEFNDKENIRPERQAKNSAKNSVFIKESIGIFSPLSQKNESLELMRDLKHQERETDEEINDKENTRPERKAKSSVFIQENIGILSPLKKKNEQFLGGKNWRVCDKEVAPLAEIDVSNFRKPELDSGALFDPNLLEAFEQAVTEVKAQEAERRAKSEDKIFHFIEEEPPLKAKIEESSNPLLEFEEKCPPGGSDSVILYTTGLRGIRKTFEDCHSIRFLLENFRVLFSERDISMHSEFKEELWQILGGKMVPPKLFIKGRYIGGAEEVLKLHEQGRLRPLFEGIPTDSSNGHCEGCGGVRFILCFNCDGSRKILPEGDDSQPVNCPKCNENGLLICPMCS